MQSRAPCSGLAQMLRGTLIRLKAAQSQSRRHGDRGGELERGLSGCDAAAMSADVDLDVDVDDDTGARGRLRDRGDRGHGVDEHADSRRPREIYEPRDLRRRDDLVRDEDIADAGGDERGSLVGLLTADAHRAARELRLRDRRALVRLGVRPQADRARGFRHAIEIALERVGVDDERRRVDRVEPVAGLRGLALQVRPSR